MKAVAAFSILFLTQILLAEADRNPVFGVYRGQGAGNQSCTVAILEQRPSQVVAFLIDQNPYVFVSSAKMLEQLQSRSLKIKLNSVERDFKDRVEITFDQRTKLMEVSTITGNITAKCRKAFQIRKQD
tara:strand:+ start:31100 stop:31483 length:384 start_codon:yes stop_codon:yes gene_type:complete